MGTPDAVRRLAPGAYTPWSGRGGDADPCRQASAIVLAGTHNWGGGTFDRSLRGPLLPVAQHPLITFPLRWLAANGMGSATICAGSATTAVRAHLDVQVPHLALDYYEDVQPRGPAGCARDAALATDADRFVVVDGALIPGLDLRALLAEHRRTGAVATTVVEIDRRRAALGGERPAMPGGIYVFERSVLEGVPETGYQDIKQGLLERLYAAGEQIAVHEVLGVAPRILDFATYSSVSSWLISVASAESDLYDGWLAVGDGVHHPTAYVDPSARMFGPVLIGPRARVEAGAVLVGPLSLGAGSVVARNAVVTRSVLWEGCVVGTRARVDASLLVDGAVVGEGVRMIGAIVDDQPESVPARPTPAHAAFSGAAELPSFTPRLVVRRS